MAAKKLNLKNFDIEKLSKRQQKTVRGGDDPTDEKDPVRGGGGGGGIPLSSKIIIK